MYPKLKIYKKGITENACKVVEKCGKAGMDVTAITKVFLADPEIAECLIKAGVNALGDSRIENLKRLECFNMEKWLIRLPMACEIPQVIKYSDVSLNSEIETVRLLDKEAARQKKVHKVILMADLGDLREGYFNTDDMLTDLEEILKMKNIEFYGIGTNLTCYGGIIPTRKNMAMLNDLKKRIEDTFSVKVKVVSGGNSSTYTLVEEGEELEGINNLRIGEAIMLGKETSYGTAVEELSQTNFLLQAQIIEIKEKPSYPIGKMSLDSFGHPPKIEDRGMMVRALCAIGKQDVRMEDLEPVDRNVEILGGSSDHMILDITRAKGNYRLGDIISFVPSYGALLTAMTSEFIHKEIID